MIECGFVLDNERYLEFLYQTGLGRYANSRFEWGGAADNHYQTVRFGSGEQHVMPIQTWIGVALTRGGRFVAVHHLPGKGSARG